MSYRLKTTLTALSVCIALSGCATVDLNEVTRPSDYQAAGDAELNVVQQAAATLNMVFRDRGFVAKTSRKRLQSAASVLLNGLEDKQIIDAKAMGYADIPKSESLILADMKYARSYIDRTVAAAQVYLEVAPVKRDLRKELVSLEKALIASTEAQSVFKAALKGAGQSDVDIFEQSVANLRDVTDEFGARVRVHDTDKLASRGLATGS